MLTTDPSERPSASEILQYSWFNVDFTKKKTMDLTEVLEDLDKRKSMKCDGKLSVAMTFKVENID